jgi:copper chaperone CopZ
MLVIADRKAEQIADCPAPRRRYDVTCSDRDVQIANCRGGQAMKRIVLVLLAAGLAATTWTGCQFATDSDVAASPADPAPSDYVLVTLKVPNMTCGGCAAVVRGDLESIDGVVDIRTDVANQRCSFRVPKSNIGYRARLAELAHTNSPLAESEIEIQ